MSGAVEGVALPDSELIYQALRFFFWSAGQGVSPINTDDAPEPEETFWQYGLRTGDEEWETVAERYRVSRTTPPARSYADGVREALAVAYEAHGGWADAVKIRDPDADHELYAPALDAILAANPTQPYVDKDVAQAIKAGEELQGYVDRRHYNASKTGYMAIPQPVIVRAIAAIRLLSQGGKA